MRFLAGFAVVGFCSLLSMAFAREIGRSEVGAAEILDRIQPLQKVSLPVYVDMEISHASEWRETEGPRAGKETVDRDRQRVQLALEEGRRALSSARDWLTTSGVLRHTGHSLVLWDGEVCVSTGFVTLPSGEEKGRTVGFSRKPDRSMRDVLWFPGTFVAFGRLESDVLPLHEVLRESSTVRVESRMEEAEGIPCVKMVAKGPYGRFECWLGPKSDYRFRKVVSMRSAGDLYREGTEYVALGARRRGGGKGCPGFVAARETWDAIRYEKRGEHVDLAGCRVVVDATREDGMHVVACREYEIKHDHDPDFEAYGSYKWNIPEGQETWSWDHPGRRYVFRGGKILPLLGKR